MPPGNPPACAVNSGYCVNNSGYGTTTHSQALIDDVWAQGVEWIRLGAYLGSSPDPTSTAEGQMIADDIERAQYRGLKVYFTLHTGSMPSEQDWEDFVDAWSDAYPDIEAWNMVNAPNVAGHFSGSIANYVTLHNWGAPIIRANCSGNELIAAGELDNVANQNDLYSDIDDILDGLNDWDFFSLHYYSEESYFSGWLDDINDNSDLQSSNPVWITEYNCDDAYSTNSEISDDIIAMFANTTSISQVEKAFAFCWKFYGVDFCPDGHNIQGTTVEDDIREFLLGQS